MQDGLEHLRLLLHDLAELLELGVIPKEIEVPEARGPRGCSGSGRSSGRTRVTPAPAAAATLLGREVEEIDVALITTSTGRLSRAAGRCRGSGGRSAPLLLNVFGDALHEISSSDSHGG